MSRKLNVGIVGLGRMGARHAHHFHALTPRANLIAASSPMASEIEWANQNLDGVRTYPSFDEMLEKETELDAVVIVSPTSFHAEHVIKAIQKGLHVLCEKPLSTSAEIVSWKATCSLESPSQNNPDLLLIIELQSQSVVDAYNTSLKRFPKQKVLCGFSRRFDASYRDAHSKMRAGLIGRPSVIRSQTCDRLDPSGFFVAFAQFSGGIFVDCSIHDIDLALWFFGEDSIVKSVYAAGITAVSPDLRKHNDRDNAVGIVEFWGGKIAYFFTSRMMAAGQEDTTEIIGTEGKLTVNCQPATNLVQIHESNGIRREIPQNYFERFKEAFIMEANEFTRCCLDDKELPFGLEGAVNAVKIGCALQESLISEKKINFDEDGVRISESEGVVKTKL